MKTMRAPKMDVVRFTESDVIVASGEVTPLFGKIAEAGDGKNDTLSVTVSNNHVYSYSDLSTGVGDHLMHLGDVVFTANGQSRTIEQLYENNESNGAFDGDYYSYDGGLTYKHQ